MPYYGHRERSHTPQPSNDPHLHPRQRSPQSSVLVVRAGWWRKYLIDGKFYDLSAVRAMAAGLGLEKSTKTATDKPRREIEVLAEAVAQDEFCQRKQIVISVFGYRNFNGQVVYTLHFVNKEGERKTCKKTLSWIRDYCKRNGVI